MEILKSLEQVPVSNRPRTIALGNFDGVHLGHQKLIAMAKNIADEINGEAFVFTFFPHPHFIFNPNFKMLNSFETKTRLIANFGIDYLISLPFTELISKLDPEEFVEKILFKTLKINHVVAGFNYSFGYQGRGKAEDLIKLTKTYGIQTSIVEPFYIENQLVSSTKIREYFKEGRIEAVTKLLGYAPSIKGKVVSGAKVGRQLGFPTANLEWDKDLLTPTTGVYAVKVKSNDQLKQGVVNIGLKPTVSNKNKLTIEVNIFDFACDIYDQELEIIFYKKLRDEKKFANLVELKNQIAEDKINTKKIFAEYF